MPVDRDDDIQRHREACEQIARREGSDPWSAAPAPNDDATPPPVGDIADEIDDAAAEARKLGNEASDLNIGLHNLGRRLTSIAERVRKCGS